LQLLGTGLTNENCIHEEIQGRLHSENACCCLISNLLLSCYMLTIKHKKVLSYNFPFGLKDDISY